MPTAKDVMNAVSIWSDPDDSVEKAISVMLKHRLTSLPVIDGADRLLGIVSEFDLIELVWDVDSDQDRVHHHMTREVHKVGADADLGKVAEMFRLLGVRRLPVVEEERLVGIVSRPDLLRYVLQARGHFAPVTPRLLAPADESLETAPTGA